MLILPIKKKWFDMIRSREKTEEYREIKPYYNSRFTCIDEGLSEVFIKGAMYVIFRNGYSKNSPSVKCLVNIDIGTGKVEWGAEPNKEYYILKILSVEELDDCL